MTHLEENNSTDKEKIDLSIQISLNGLSFCILSRTSKMVLFYKKTIFEKKLNPTEVLQQIKLLYAKETVLQTRIDKVLVIFSNELYSLVPHLFFKEEKAPDYLKYNAKILQTDFIAHDVIAKPQIVNVYIPYANISNYFFDLYGEFDYKHATTIFIENILGLKNSSGARMFLNNNHGMFDLAVVENNKLLLCNSFYYTTKEDFLYYILFTAEQLKLNTSEFELILMGQIDENSELYDIAYTYIKHISFFEELSFKLKDEIKEEALRKEFILMRSFLYEDSFRNT